MMYSKISFVTSYVSGQYLEYAITMEGNSFSLCSNATFKDTVLLSKKRLVFLLKLFEERFYVVTVCQCVLNCFLEFFCSFNRQLSRFYFFYWLQFHILYNDEMFGVDFFNQKYYRIFDPANSNLLGARSKSLTKSLNDSWPISLGTFSGAGPPSYSSSDENSEVDGNDTSCFGCGSNDGPGCGSS